jgi:predicted PurR-regulated permease PerM
VQPPAGLRLAAGWTWRLLVLAAGVVVLARALAELRLVVLPCLLAVLLATVLWPAVAWLRARRVPAAAAAALVLTGFLAVLAGVVAALGPAVAAQTDELGRELVTGADQVTDWVANGPLAGAAPDVDRSVESALEYARDNAGRIGGGVLSGAALAVEVLAGLLLALVVTFFLLKDGEAFRDRTLELLAAGRRAAAERLGFQVWRTLGGYVRGLAVVAVFDAVVIGLALLAIGVPLVLPLAVLTFFGAFLPIIGAFLAGLAAALVALVAGGVGDAILVVVAITIIQQIESQVLYPVVVGRSLDLHPLPILLAVTAGGVLYGIVGAALGAPVLAVAARIAGFAHQSGPAGAPTPPQMQ